MTNDIIPIKNISVKVNQTLRPPQKKKLWLRVQRDFTIGLDLWRLAVMSNDFRETRFYPLFRAQGFRGVLFWVTGDAFHWAKVGSAVR